MKVTLLLALVLIFTQSLSSKKSIHYNVENDSPCLSAEEIKLYHLIMAYRKQKKLPMVPLSLSLTKVAQAHAKDLMENHKLNGPCNMHSWSEKGSWKNCCYTPDHKQKECMWNKPKEITNYPTEGFEVAYFYSGGVMAEGALDTWKKSKGHNPVLINSGIWKDLPWNAIGVGIYQNYATVWFGHSIDAEGAPGKCK